MEGSTARAGEDGELHFNRVSRDFFATMQTRLIAGGRFSDADTLTSRRVAVVNELLADRYFGANAVGRRITAARTNSRSWESSPRAGAWRCRRCP